MKIRHERPQADLQFQVRAPLVLELKSGQVVKVTEWSLLGFEYPEPCDVLPREATLSIPFQGVDIRFPVGLERQGEGQFLRFSGLTGRQREALSLFYRSLLSGRMAATDEVITALDAPVDLVPMEETTEEKASATTGKPPRSLRAAASVTGFALVGLIVGWALVSGIWGKLAHVDIQNARIEAALIAHVSAGRGVVKEVLVNPGDTVARGALLVRIVDPGAASSLAELRGRIDLIEQRLEAATRKESELAARLAAARAAILSARQPRFVGVEALLDAIDARFAPAYRDLFAAHDAALAQRDTLGDELRRLKRERGRLRDAGDARHVLAAEAGQVREVAVLQGQLVSEGTAVAVLEGRAARHARGWLGPDMAAAVHAGMPVRATLASASGPMTLSAEVITVEAGIAPELSAAFGMLVTVAFPTLSAEETRAALAHLAPVSLSAQRGRARRWEDRFSALRQRVLP